MAFIHDGVHDDREFENHSFHCGAENIVCYNLLVIFHGIFRIVRVIFCAFMGRPCYT